MEQRERKREQNEIARILNYYRISMPEGIDLLAADWHESILRQSGLIPRKITLEGAWWKEAFLPMELYGEDDRIYAAVPVGNHYHVWIEEQEKVVDTQLAKQFQRTARCFYKPFSCENKGTGMLWRFLWESIPHTDLIVILVISLFVELCGLLMPYINSVVYNRVIPSGTAREIPGIVVLVISTVIFSTLLSLYKEICRVRLGKKAAYAWSAGKDSIVLGKLCEAAGVNNSLIGVCNLEYPAFMQWIEENKPQSCEIINVGLDLDWLAKHEKMLFPQDSSIAGHWFSIVQHKAQREYFLRNELDMILLGRRRADGNYTGKGGNIYTDSKGVTRFSPIADWTHEQVLAFIYYNEIPLPPIYGWKNGYLCGTHPWPARQWTGSTENGWQEVYDIDPSIVTAAAEKIESAKRFLEKGGVKRED